MSRPEYSLPAPGDAPFQIEVTRGPAVESRHRVSCAVVDAVGATVAAWGDVERPVYPRSSLKPLQALPLVESGAADAHDVSERELSLACASHNGEAAHLDTVGAWLGRIGLTVEDLACGPQWPRRQDDLHDLVRAGGAPTRADNNCSGKHTGMLTTAL
ncbi:MAG: asparaginase, partial [Minwuiales bacterium]|nr:asparaginase [Minwuiales bacterium]